MNDVERADAILIESAIVESIRAGGRPLVDLLLEIVTNIRQQYSNAVEPRTRSLLSEMRSRGWTVAVHNDYRVNGIQMTFWLFTHASGHWVKGEGTNDTDACLEAYRAILKAE